MSSSVHRPVPGADLGLHPARRLTFTPPTVLSTCGSSYRPDKVPSSRRSAGEIEGVHRTPQAAWSVGWRCRSPLSADESPAFSCFGATPSRLWPLHAPDLVLVGQ